MGERNGGHAGVGVVGVEVEGVKRGMGSRGERNSGAQGEQREHGEGERVSSGVDE